MGSVCTSTSTSSASLPEWLTGPASETIQRSVTESQRGYTPYTDGRVAQINPTQQKGIDVLRASQGNWGAQFGDAQSDLWAARDAPGSMDAGRGYVDTAANASGLHAARGYLDEAADASGLHAARGYLDTAAGMSSLGAASPLIESGTGAGGLATASPFLAAASQTAPSALSAYMSPYQSGVVDEIGRLGSRNLTENILPKISDTFIGSGQFGSDRNAATIGRAIRDTSRDIAGQQSAALQAGYGQAGQLFTSDANRQAQLAGTAGNLGESAAGRDLTGASLAANATNADASRIFQAGTTVGALTNTDADRRAQIGRDVGALTNTDAARSLEAGRTVAGFAGQDQAAALANSRQSAALAGQQQTQNITDANALMAAGGVQQQTSQRSADAAFEEAMRGQKFNRDQLTWLNSIIRGTPYGQTTTQTQQPSLWSVLGFRDGGRVPALAMGGRPSWYDDEYDYEEEDDDGYMGGGYGGGRRGWAKSAQAFIKPQRDKPGLLGRALRAAKFIPGLADGGYVDDEEDELFPAEGDALDDSGSTDDGGGEDAELAAAPMQMAQAPLAAASSPGPGLPAKGEALDDAGSTDDGDGEDAELVAAPMQMAQAPLAAASSPGPGLPAKGEAPVSALSILRDRALNRSSNDPDIKAAMEGVDAAQKAALASRPAREESWMDSPLAVGAAGFLAAPKGTGVLGRVGHGALEAVTRRQTQRRLDQTEDQARRMESLKVAQQRLSNILSMRTADTRALTSLAGVEGANDRARESATARVEAAKTAAQARIDAAREAGAGRQQIAQIMAEGRADVARIIAESRQGVATTQADSRRDVAGMNNDTRQLIQKARSGDAAAALEVKNRGLDLNAEARKLDRESRDRIADGRLVPKEVRLADKFGFDLETDDGRQQFADFTLKIKPPNGYAPTQIEKAQKIIDDPNAAPELKDAARGILADKSGKSLSAAQLANLRGRAATLAQGDVAGLGKDFQFQTPEEQQAFVRSRTDAHLKWLREGSDPDAAPPEAQPPQRAAPAPGLPPPVVPAAVQPPPGEAGTPASPAAAAKHAPALAPVVTAPMPRPKGLTEAQAKTNMFGTLMEKGHGEIGNVTVPSDAAIMAWRNLPEGATTFGLSDNDKRYFNSLRTFAAGVLRKETGAAFAPFELLDVQSRFFPMPNDSPELIKQKADSRKQAIESMRAEMPEGKFRGQIAVPDASAAPKRPAGVPGDWNYGTVKGKPGWISPDKKSFSPEK